MILSVGFSKARSPLALGSLAIRLFERAPFSHAFLRWHSDRLEQDMVYQASHGMVHFVSGDRFDANAETVIAYCFTLTEEQATVVMKKCVELAGIKYGTLEMFGIAFERITGIRSPFRDDARTYVCSELVGTVLNQCGVAQIDLDLELAGPAKLERAVAAVYNLGR